MHDELITQLKRLSAITPDPAFIRRTRGRWVHPRLLPTWLTRPIMQSAGIAMIALIAIAISSFMSSPSVVLSSSLDPQSIADELHDTVAIQVDQILYESRGNTAVDAVIREIRNIDTSHLSSDLLSSELQSFDGDTGADVVDALLERITQ